MKLFARILLVVVVAAIVVSALLFVWGMQRAIDHRSYFVSTFTIGYPTALGSADAAFTYAEVADMHRVDVAYEQIPL